MYAILYTRTAKEGIPKLKAAHLDHKACALIDIIRKNPYRSSPPFEKLVGKLQGALSRRINIKHRLVYQVVEEEKKIKIISLWTHYEW